MRQLEIRKLSKIFDLPPDRQVVALEHIDLTVTGGEFVSIIGPTGCGKTTLLRIVAGLEAPMGGEILLDGRPVDDLHRISTLVFQQYSLFPWCNVLQNVAFPMEMKGVDKKTRHERARDYIHLVGLTGFEKAEPYELSGGMQQRVAIARALAYDPEVLLMDEPFGALDERTRNRLQNVLLDIWSKKRKTILFVTHNIDEAIYLADRIIVMGTEPGRIKDNIRIDLLRLRNRLDEEFVKLHIEIRNALELEE